MKAGGQARNSTAGNETRSSFSSRLGYVLAVAGSAVGLGNIWRFPYLAAKYGGGIFLLVYLILMLTFGYALIMSETALGRMTRRSPVGAFQAFGKSWHFRLGGWVNAIIPMLIVPYYCVIGGWVTKYLFEYLRGSTIMLADDNYFPGFIAESFGAEFWFLLFSVAVVLVLLAGVKHGVERVSKVMMPLLVILAIFVAGYAMTRPGALEGVKYFLYTYGSYMKKDVDIEKSTFQVEAFDTGIAMLAGLMVIPAVFAFSGGDPDALKAGPSLMFITIPKVFASMGFGTGAGLMFFLLVFMAALTSAISLAESGVSTFEDQLGCSRKACTLLMGTIIIILGSASALGFGVLDFVAPLGMSLLDFFDFLTNSLMMPVAALSTCLLVTRVVGLKKITEEVELSSRFKQKQIYAFMIKYLAPIFIIIILLSSMASVLGWISM